jgi:hypothetical protein
MAKKRGVAGWHAMRKDQLVRALIKAAKSESSPAKAKKSSATAKSRRKAASADKPAKTSAAQRRIQKMRAHQEQLKDLATKHEIKQPTEDKIILMVRDPYWLQATWELTASSVERAQAALDARWHGARPVLRLIALPTNATATTEHVIRVIDIHGGVNNWYIDVPDPPSSFRVDIGYETADGQFHSLARSNVVTTPQPGKPDVIHGNWSDVAENSERIFAMSGGYQRTGERDELREWLEDRLRRPLGSPMVTKFGNGAAAVVEQHRTLNFGIDAEMIVYGMTDSTAFVTMSGEPVSLNPDGTFTARVPLPDRRQVIPIVASTNDGVEEQTIVLAVERNTKVMEAKIRQPGE